MSRPEHTDTNRPETTDAARPEETAGASRAAGATFAEAGGGAVSERGEDGGAGARGAAEPPRPEAEPDVPDPEHRRVAASLLVLGGLVLGVVLAFVATRVLPALGGDATNGMAMGSGEGSGHDHEEQGQVWTCPMHPFVESDGPGACPVCGMDLVPRVSSTGLDPVELARLGRVAINPVERVLANVATVEVARADLTTDLNAYGQLVYDETTYATIPAWVGGRVESLYIQETGTEVERGQRLLSIYSPELLAAQEEYLVILRGGRATEGLAESAERRLRLVGMSRRQIDRLAERGETTDTVTVYAPAEGTIVERLVQEGEYVREGQPLFRLAGSQNIWVEAEVYEQDVPWVHEGMQAEVSLVAFPGETFSGVVTLVWPFVHAETRTLRLRVEFDSIDPRLRAGMYASVELLAPVVDDALVVPTQAVIRTGERNAVYVEIEENLFERREIELGYRSSGLFEVRSGVAEGETVVAQGGFLIDSEAQLYAGGQSLHYGHGTEGGGGGGASGAQASGDGHEGHGGEAAQLEDVPMGNWFCPTDPSEHSDEAGRCSENNMQMIQRTEALVYDPDADPVTWVQPGEWYCPMGAEWVAEEEGRCPLCGMFLVQKAEDDASESPAGDAHAGHGEAAEGSDAESDDAHAGHAEH